MTQVYACIRPLLLHHNNNTVYLQYYIVQHRVGHGTNVTFKCSVHVVVLNAQHMLVKIHCLHVKFKQQIERINLSHDFQLVDFEASFMRHTSRQFQSAHTVHG